MHGCELGLERVIKELSDHRLESAKTICRRLWHAVQEHSGPVPHQDDFTTVIVKRR